MPYTWITPLSMSRLYGASCKYSDWTGGTGALGLDQGRGPVMDQTQGGHLRMTVVTHIRSSHFLMGTAGLHTMQLHWARQEVIFPFLVSRECWLRSIPSTEGSPAELLVCVMTVFPTWLVCVCVCVCPCAYIHRRRWTLLLYQAVPVCDW